MIAMAEETVTVGDTEVQITETDDGFEVEPVEADPGTVEKFKEDTRLFEGEDLCVGSIEQISPSRDGEVKIKVNNSDWDVMDSNFFLSLDESPWSMSEIEWEAGYVLVKDSEY